MAVITYNVDAAVVAHAGGGFALATVLTKQYNDVITVATAGDSVLLPPIIAGQTITLRNSGLFYLNAYPPGVIIDGGSEPTPFRVQPGQTVKFNPFSATEYKTDNPAGGFVTQATNITTSVTLNALKGQITTQAASAAAGASHSFTLNNSFIQADTPIFPWIMDYSGTTATNGLPFVTIDTRADGSCVFVVSNAHPTNALNGTLVIGFRIDN